jgi:nitrate/TMAO reductase-like tetraheme cytochrome c subunit
MSNAGAPAPPTPPADSPSIKRLFRNYISLIGLALAAVSLANIIFLFLIDVISKRPSPYIGIFAYMVMPAFLILGLVLIVSGMWMQRQRHLRGVAGLPRFPVLDLNNPKQRSTIAFFTSAIVLFVMLSAVGSYRAYEYTDSVQFCGQLCHTVMHPEFTTHQASPHARVACVDCHVGAGASWYVRSKLSGTRQVFKTILNTYPRPIETPVRDLRPAQETCEQCHWPRKFWGAQLKVINTFSSDEQNTPRQLQMLIKTGGGNPELGQASGIHWHMNITNIITYASDAKRQNIPYVHVQDMKGNVREYFAQGANPADIAKMAKRRMDCVDCHNRPTHIYAPPDRSVDDSMAARRMDASLPYLKQQAVQVLTAGYKTTAEAMQAIAKNIPAFYQEKYPQVAAAKQVQIQAAVAEVQRIFASTVFPEMKVDWRTDPDNLGHYYFPGCFRCHDGNHASKDGKVITKDCNVCHTVLSQSEGTAPAIPFTRAAFKHPIDLGDLTGVNCSDCHTGGAGP